MLASLPLVVAAAMGACNGNGDVSPASSADSGACGPDAPVGPPDAPAIDAPTDVADARGPGTLALSLDPALDGVDDDVKASSITSADLLDKTGQKVTSATIAAEKAVFNLAAVKGKDDYFILVNGDADDLVPTRIEDPSDNVAQRVGTKLRASWIGPADAPRYRIKTYSAGQKESPVVKFSDGTVIPGEQPYVILSLTPPKIEFRLLGSAAMLSSLVPNATHTDEPFDAWLLNTDGFLHHGDAFVAPDGGVRLCSSCHAQMGTKPATYGGISLTAGTCFHCHYGTDGDKAGFVDSAR
jgi:hypothetical protein